MKFECEWPLPEHTIWSVEAVAALIGKPIKVNFGEQTYSGRISGADLAPGRHALRLEVETEGTPWQIWSTHSQDIWSVGFPEDES